MANRIDHPSHYNQGGDLDADGSAQFEAIKLIEDLGWGFGFCMGNALKYILRAPYKGNELGDLKKARWYLERACEHPGWSAQVRARALRRFDPAEAKEAWGVQGERLSQVLDGIFGGDPFQALDHLNVYLFRPEDQ